MSIFILEFFAVLWDILHTDVMYYQELFEDGECLVHVLSLLLEGLLTIVPCCCKVFRALLKEQDPVVFFELSGHDS